MIKYNNSNINDWNFGNDNIAKVYYGVTSGTTSRLPSGYTEVEYVESTGQSTVNLEIQLMKNVGDTYDIVFDNEMSYTSSYGEHQTFLTCCNEAGSPWPGWYERFEGTTSNVVIGGSNGINLSTGRTLVSGSTYHVTITGNTDSSSTHDYPLNLFSSLDSTKTPWRFCKGKLYNMQVTYNNTLVRDLVPCTNPSNVAGLYDLVNDVFYSSESGYAPLVAGSAVTPSSSTTVGNVVYQKVINGVTPPTPPSPSGLPSGYTEVEYIENVTSGTNYYIDTGFKPNQDTRVVVEAQATDLTNYPRIFGSGPWNGLAYVGNIESDSPPKFYFKYGQTSSWWQTNVTADTNKHTFDLNKNSYYIDGVLANTASTSTFQLTTNLGIFNAPSTNSFQNTETFIGKVFSCKVYDNGTLIRDYVPCYRDTDSKSGLYDIVNDVFYTAVNTDYNFTVGDPV